MNEMNDSKNRNEIIIVLLALVLVVWGLGLAGWVKNFTGGVSLFERGSDDALESQIIDKPTPFEPPVQTPYLQKLDETAPIETPVQTQAPQEFDASGIWDMTFRRYTPMRTKVHGKQSAWKKSSSGWKSIPEINLNVISCPTRAT